MRRLLLAALLAALGAPAPAAAQDHPRLATLAALLAAEDRREYRPELFEAAMRDDDPTVRRQAVLGAGRIQDRRAREPLLALLGVPDTTLHAAVMFALGLLGDSTAAPAIIARLADPMPLAVGALAEAPSTLAKLGTAAARTLFSRLLDGTSQAVSVERRRIMLPGLLVEGWRFGRHAPVQAALTHLTDTSDAVRWRAAYLLGRTRAAAGTQALLQNTGDPQPWVRQYAVRGLTRPAADSAGLAADMVKAALIAALRDPDPGVRVNALGALATWRDTAQTAAVIRLLRDPIPNVRLQAVTALGAISGAAALGELRRLGAARREPIVIRREALLGLLRADTAAVRQSALAMIADADPRLRQLGVELAALTRPRDSAPFRALLDDGEVEVRVAALNASAALNISVAPDWVETLLTDPDRRVRAAGWGQWTRRELGPEHVHRLVAGWRWEMALGRDGVTAPILAALRRAWNAGGASRQAVETEFLATAERPDDYLLRRAAQNWPELAARWGPIYPGEVKYREEDYRRIAANYLLSPPATRPRVKIMTANRGAIELELLADQAPLTVANFLELVDEGFFDGGTWHRVIPNFVVQDGAGGAPLSPARAPIRDEFNPVRYDLPVLGMALSGPDTGTSQWFINLSPQPHLDGGYTVFGRVVGTPRALDQILQGDLLISIRR